MAELQGGKIIFLGISQSHPDSLFVAFRNSESGYKIVLSLEAANALGKLLTESSEMTAHLEIKIEG